MKKNIFKNNQIANCFPSERTKKGCSYQKLFPCQFLFLEYDSYQKLFLPSNDKEASTHTNQENGHFVIFFSI